MKLSAFLVIGVSLGSNTGLSIGSFMSGHSALAAFQLALAGASLALLMYVNNVDRAAQ